MIRQRYHRDRSRWVSPYQGDADGERRNGFPASLGYIPADPERRRNLLSVLGLLKNEPVRSRNISLEVNDDQQARDGEVPVRPGDGCPAD